MSADAGTLAAYAGRAQDYAGRFNRARPDADLQAFIDAVPAGGRVLDLGCGPAATSAHMRAAGLDPDPVDASPEMVALANETFDISARLGEFDDVNAEAEYDGVWANFSLLHAPRSALPRHFAAIARALKPAGVLHVGLKTGSGEKRDALGRYYSFVTVHELQELLTEAGLRVVFVREGEERGLAGTLDPYVICRAIKPSDA